MFGVGHWFVAGRNRSAHLRLARPAYQVPGHTLPDVKESRYTEPGSVMYPFLVVHLIIFTVILCTVIPLLFCMIILY